MPRGFEVERWRRGWVAASDCRDRAVKMVRGAEREGRCVRIGTHHERRASLQVRRVARDDARPCPSAAESLKADEVPTGSRTTLGIFPEWSPSILDPLR